MKLKEDNIDYLKYYTDLKNESSFSGIDNFYKPIKKIYPRAKRSEVKKWLLSQDSYTSQTENKQVSS